MLCTCTLQHKIRSPYHDMSFNNPLGVKLRASRRVVAKLKRLEVLLTFGSLAFRETSCITVMFFLDGQQGGNPQESA